MHRLDKTVNSAITGGVLLGGMGIALFIWFLVYTQERVDSFATYSDDIEIYLR